VNITNLRSFKYEPHPNSVPRPLKSRSLKEGIPIDQIGPSSENCLL
jgi:hypothetical protein